MNVTHFDSPKTTSHIRTHYTIVYWFYDDCRESFASHYTVQIPLNRTNNLPSKKQNQTPAIFVNGENPSK
jgi:hypothetical protein